VLTWGSALQYGRTPLFIAAQAGKEAVAQVLLQAGADKAAKELVRAKG
jgi:ankyrin repeat protein